MYKYNGNTYSLEDLKIVLGVEEITQDILTQYGITEAEEEVKIDPPTTTVDEVGKSNDVVEDAIATSDEERASMLELELERISSELEKIDPYKDAETVTYKSFGGYEQKQIGVDNAALKKEQELKEKRKKTKDELERVLFNIGPNIDIPATLVSSDEEAVEKYLRQQVPWARVKQTDAGDGVNIYIDEDFYGFGEGEIPDWMQKPRSEGEPIYINLQPNTEEGRKIAIDQFKRINAFGNALSPDAKRDYTLDVAIAKMEELKDPSDLNYLLKGTGYRIDYEKTYKDSGMKTREEEDSIMLPEHNYVLVKDGSAEALDFGVENDGEPIVVASDIEGIRTTLKDNIVGSELYETIISNNAFEAQKDFLIAKNEALEKEKQRITNSPDLTLDYFEDQFEKDLLEALGYKNKKEAYQDPSVRPLLDHFSSLTKATRPGAVPTYGANITMKLLRFFTGTEEASETDKRKNRISAYQNLGDLPEDLQQRLIDAGFGGDNSKFLQDNINKYAHNQLINKSDKIIEGVMKRTGNQSLIRLSQRFLEVDENIFKEELDKKVKTVQKIDDQYRKLFAQRGKNIEKMLPKGAEFEISILGGVTQLNLKYDGELNESQQKAFNKAQDELMDLQYVMGIYQQDYAGTMQNIQTEIAEYYAQGRGVDKSTFDFAAKDYNLSSILAKDIGDSFKSVFLTVPTLLGEDSAVLEQERMNQKNQLFETMIDYDDGNFLRYAIRTTGQQSANLTLAIGTAGTGSALGLTNAVTRVAIGTTFGLTSGTQTFRDLKTQQEIYDYAVLKGKQADRALREGIIGQYEHTQIMLDVNKTKAMGRLTDNQIIGASWANGFIEGAVTTAVGTAPNSIKLLKDFKAPTKLTEIGKNLFKSDVTKLYNFIGKPIGKRVGGEILEEELIYGGQQFVTEYGILGRDFDLSNWDDVAVASLTVSGVSQGPGVGYSGMMTYGATSKYESAINKLRINTQNLSDLVADPNNNLTDSQRKDLIFSIAENLKEQGLETDKLSIDIMNLGSDNVKRLIGNSIIKQDLLKQAGVTPDMNDVQQAEVLNSYKKGLKESNPQALEDFNNQLNAIDTQINNIKKKVESPGSYKRAKESLGNIYNVYDAQYKREGRVFDSESDKLATILEDVRQDINTSNMDKAKANPEIVETVENIRIDKEGNERYTKSGESDKRFKPLNDAQKDAMYSDFGRLITLNSARGVANKINIETSVQSILGDDVKLEVAGWKTKEDLEALLENEIKDKQERLDAFTKLNDGKVFGLIVGNKIITQNEKQAQEDLDKGIVRAGTVVLHEINHAIDDGRINTPEGKLNYATNLFKAASESDNAQLKALHEYTMDLLNGIYGPRGETFENSEVFRDEYTKYLQEQAFAYEDQLQLEKDESNLIKAFNSITTNANALNTPQKALDYMLANNSGFRSGKLSKKSQDALKNRKPTEALKYSERNINELAKEYKLDPAEVDLIDLLDQYRRLGLAALGYNQAKGDIAANDVLSFIDSEFVDIMRTFDIDNTAEFSTYATNLLQRRGRGFYKKTFEGKEGRQSITAASEATRLVAEDTAETGLELEERAARERREEKKLIDPLKSKEVSNKIKDIEAAVDITPSKAPIADFKNISRDYGGKVASIIFNVPEVKITDGTKNLTYAKKIVDGIPESSEAGNIQNLYSDLQTLARDIRLLPDTNVTSDESRVGDEKVPVTRDVQGRSLGLPNRIIKYFYEDTGARSKGTTSQTKVYRKKAKFNNPTTEVLKEVQEQMGITPARELNKYDRTIGQFLKGFAKVKGAVTSVAVAKNKVKAMDLKTAKGKKQIEADVGAGRSSVQFSEKAKVRRAFDLELSGRSKVDRLMSVYSVNPTLNLKQLVLTEEGREQIVNTFRDEVFILLPKAAWQQRDSFTSSNDSYGVSISKGTKAEVEGFRKLKSDIKAAIDSAPDSAFGANIEGVTDFKLSSYDTVFKGSETDIKDKADKFNDKTTKIHKALWERINKRIAGDKQRASAIATYLKLTANDKSSWHRKGAAIYGYSINPKQRYEYEHAMPATSAYLYLLNSILGKQNFSQSYDLVMQNYKVIALDKAEDNKLRKAGLQRSMPFGWDIVDNFWWQRYFNPSVAKQNNGINPTSIVDLDGNNLQDVFNINNDGSTHVKGFKPEASSVITFDNKADKAMADARNSVKYSEKTKKARVFDFDDTLARSKSKVIVTMPDGTVSKIDATEFALEAANLEDQGATFDFAEFSKVIDGKKGPLFDVAKKIADVRGTEDIFILTARPQEAAVAIKKFLSELGLNIPLRNITGLADGKPKAKADWFVEKYAEGYNDFYFADDALKNVKAVKDIFNVLDVKSRVQQARVKFSEKLSEDFNKMIERNKGVKAEANFSDIQARRRGKNQKRFAFFIPPSADDFRGLTMYTFAGKGKQGEADQEFFDKALIRPYQAGIAAINVAKTKVRNDYLALLKNNKPIKRKLKKKVAGTTFTLDEAIRIYLWTNEDYDIPGISKRDQKTLVDFVKEDADLVSFAEGVKLVTRKDQYLKPTEFWDASTILGDLGNVANSINRAEYLKEFIDNAKVIFSDTNLNKIQAIYGFRVRESLENILFRMETGQNKNKGAGRIVNAWNNWVNNSVGAIMFFNRRSALLQTLSTVNFINWSDNNPIKAGAAFANQPQYWKDFKTLWNSPKLVSRRRGLQSDIQEAEIAKAAKAGGAKGVISYLLKIGFTPTQLADSFAIASGGATFYRNRIKSYQKEGMTLEEAEKKAFIDFSSIADETQQSADPMLISQQQAGVLGRLVLAFQNTPMQYTRLIKKAGQDLINRRGNPMTHMSKIIFYGFIQNFIFSTLQSAVFALLPGFEEEPEEFDTDKEREKYFEKKQKKEEGKTARVMNSMMDTLLRGSGLAGAVVSTVKNVAMEYYEQEDASPIEKDNAEVLLAIANISPPIGSKLRKINSAMKTREFEKDVLAERGFDVMIDGKFQLSPAYDILGDVSSAAFNLPLDRAIDEINAVTEALDTRNTQWQRLALGLGWRQWDVNARVEEHDLLKVEGKAKRKAEGKIKASDTRKRNKKIRNEYLKLKEKVFFNLPENIQKEIKEKERKTGFDIPTYKLKEYAKEYNIDISNE
jgi:hypothetical protein